MQKRNSERKACTLKFRDDGEYQGLLGIEGI